MLKALVAAMLMLGVAEGAVDEKSAPELKGAATVKSIYEFTVKDIDGNDVSLAPYKGRVCLIVNVASK